MYNTRDNIKSVVIDTIVAQRFDKKNKNNFKKSILRGKNISYFVVRNNLLNALEAQVVVYCFCYCFSRKRFRVLSKQCESIVDT